MRRSNGDMETNTHPRTKQEALEAIGARTKRTTRRLGELTEFVELSPNRTLIGVGAFSPTVLVGLSGSVTVTDALGRRVLDSPFLIDKWIADERLIASATVETSTAVAMLLVDHASRDAVFEIVPDLNRLADRTLTTLHTPVAEPLDVRENAALEVG